MNGLQNALAGAAVLVSFVVQAQTNVNVQINLWRAYGTYFASANLTVTNPAAATHHRVESPNGLIYRNVGNDNDASFPNLSYSALIDECTNGLWKFTFNVGDASELEYHFALSLGGISGSLFGDIDVLDPFAGESVATNQPLISWSNTSMLPSLFITVSEYDFPYAPGDSAFLPPSTTNWTPTIPLSGSHYDIYLSASSNNFAGASFSTPTNTVNGGTLPGWMAAANLISYTYSDFYISGGGSPLGDAVDAPELTWTTGGDWDWIPQTLITDDGIDAALSEVSDNNFYESWIETTVTGPGTIDFYWYIDADYSDWMLFEIDGNYEYDIYGQDGWTNPGGIEVPPGEVTLRWTFYNDDDAAEFSDIAALDQVVYTPEAVDHEAELSLDIRRVFSGTNSYFLMFPRLSYTHPEPVTTHEVESPNGSSSGDTSGSSSIHYPTVLDLINEIEAGDWTLYFDREGPGHTEYTFNGTVTLPPYEPWPPITIWNPSNGAQGVSTNPVYSWSAILGFDELSVLVRDDEAGQTLGYASLATTSNTWSNGPALPPGNTNSFRVTYSSNDFTSVSFSTPEDINLNPIFVWSVATKVSVHGYSQFVTGLGLTILPVELFKPRLYGSEFGFEFISQSGTTHHVDYSTNLMDDSWIPLTNFPGDGLTNLVTVPTTNPAAYYRIETQ